MTNDKRHTHHKIIRHTEHVHAAGIYVHYKLSRLNDAGHVHYSASFGWSEDRDTDLRQWRAYGIVNFDNRGKFRAWCQKQGLPYTVWSDL